MPWSNVLVEIHLLLAQQRNLWRLRFVQNAILFTPVKKKLLTRWGGLKNLEKDWQRKENDLTNLLISTNIRIRIFVKNSYFRKENDVGNERY